MSYIDEFLENNSTLPRDIIRLVKLMREVDEKAYKNKRAIVKSQLKSKNKIDKNDPELQNQLIMIDKENDKIMTLHDHKLDILKECNYLIDYHLNRTNDLIKNYEKNIQANLLNGNLSLNEDKPDKSLSYLEEQTQQSTSKKKIYESAQSSKNHKIITDSINNDNFVNSKFTKKKKMRPSKTKLEKETNDIIQNSYDYTGPQENIEEEKYCVCNRVSFGEMIGCDNENCNKGQWFHFECVNIEKRPKGSWYCSKECEISSKKKKK